MTTQQLTNQPTPKIIIRFLTLDDIEQLLILENHKWENDQAANAQTILQRIKAFPDFCVGAFCSTTGRALASLFMKPTTLEDLNFQPTWEEAASIHHDSVPKKSNALFGISLSSVNHEAVTKIFEFYWPYLLKFGYQDIYLGSPLPGLKSWLEENPGRKIYEYVKTKRSKLPNDPQLRYYYKKGFKQVTAVKAKYFPHQKSLDHAAIIRCKIPLSNLNFIWKKTPVSFLQKFQKILFKVV
jgi:hypothetical protein